MPFTSNVVMMLLNDDCVNQQSWGFEPDRCTEDIGRPYLFKCMGSVSKDK